MGSTSQEIKNNLLFALHHREAYLLSPYPRIALVGLRPPRGDPPEETRDEKICRYWCYWNEFRGLLPPHQIQAIRWRHIVRANWPMVAENCGVGVDVAQQYISHGLATIVVTIMEIQKTSKPLTLVSSCVSVSV